MRHLIHEPIYNTTLGEAGLEQLRQNGWYVLQLARLPNPLPSHPTRPIAIYQDLSEPDFESPLAKICRHLIQPALTLQLPVRFISKLPATAYQARSLPPEWLHQMLPAVRDHLAWSGTLQRLWPIECHGSPPSNRLLTALDPDLDTEQRQAVQHQYGPLLVLAPAGAGKTKTLVNRIVNLVNNGVAPERILALAFNRQAMQEMNARLQQRGLAAVNVRTFHALGYEIIRQQLGWQYQATASERELQLLSACIQEQALSFGHNREHLLTCLAALHQIKTELLPPHQVNLEIAGHTVDLAELFALFWKRQTAERLLTYTDMIYLALRLLLKNPNVRQQWQNRFDYVMVDEFQDLNTGQLLLAEMLTLPQDNFFAVGDDDQLIYAWRGAELAQLLNFSQYYPHASQVVLQTNYRATRAVVRHARWLIEHNQQRVLKAIRPSDQAAVGCVQVGVANDLWEQAQLVATWLQQQAARNAGDWGQFAVLFRTHALQFVLALACQANGIPHTPIDIARLYRTNPAQDIAAYLTVLLQPNSATPNEIARVLRRPNKFLTNATIATIRSWAAVQLAPTLPESQSWERTQLRDFLAELTALRSAGRASQWRPAQWVAMIAQTFALPQLYQTQSDHWQPELSSEWVLFEILCAVANAHNDPLDWLKAMRAEQNATHQPITSQPAATAQSNQVLFSTIHQAKGREYPFVVYFDVSRYETQPPPTHELEEERRVAYVAITRAQERLLITTNRTKPATFVREMVNASHLAGLSNIATEQQLITLSAQLQEAQTELDQTVASLAALPKSRTSVEVTTPGWDWQHYQNQRVHQKILLLQNQRYELEQSIENLQHQIRALLLERNLRTPPNIPLASPIIDFT
jgi:DNA helicase-2/ATP-dependent DNA helicase PcrA